MKKALRITFGTMLAASMIAPTTALAYKLDLWRNSAIHVNGTWTKVTENSLNFGDAFTIPPLSQFGVRRATFLNPDWNFDWAAGYTYHFPCTHTRLFFHYDHYNNTHHSNSEIDTIGLLPSSSAAGGVHDKSDEFTLGIDRRIAFGSRYTIDTAFFVEWDRVRRNFNQSSTIVIDNIEAVRNTSNRFKGFGPGVGIKGRAIPFSCENIGVFASLASTMLYGKNKFRSFEEISTVLQYALYPEDTRSIVNKFDITFGVDYKSILQLDCNRIQFSAALGLRYLNYINVFKNGNTFYSPLLASSATALNTGFPEDWGRIGPFLQFRIGGENA